MSNYSFKSLRVSVSAEGARRTETAERRTVWAQTVWTVIMGDSVRQFESGFTVSAHLLWDHLWQICSRLPHFLLTHRLIHTHIHTHAGFVHLFLSNVATFVFNFSNRLRSLREEAIVQPILPPPTVCLKMCVRVSEQQQQQQPMRTEWPERFAREDVVFAIVLQVKKLILVLCNICFLLSMKRNHPDFTKTVWR